MTEVAAGEATPPVESVAAPEAPPEPAAPPPAPAPAPASAPTEEDTEDQPWVLQLGNYLSGKSSAESSSDPLVLRVGTYLAKKKPGPWSILANEKPDDPMVSAARLLVLCLLCKCLTCHLDTPRRRRCGWGPSSTRLSPSRSSTAVRSQRTRWSCVWAIISLAPPPRVPAHRQPNRLLLLLLLLSPRKQPCLRLPRSPCLPSRRRHRHPRRQQRRRVESLHYRPSPAPLSCTILGHPAPLINHR